MTENIEDLLDQAFEAEKFGDRAGAIRIYRQIAEGDSEHVKYAENCAANLEQHASNVENDNPKTNAVELKSGNPFASPNSTIRTKVHPDADYSNTRRTQLSANILRALTVFCLLTALYSGFTTQFKVGYSDMMSWSSWLLLTIIDYSIVAGLVAIAWLSSRYAEALQRLLPLSSNRIGTYASRQLWFSISLAIVAFLLVARELAVFCLPYPF